MIYPRIRRITSSLLNSSSSRLVTWRVQNIYFSKLEIHTYPLLFVKVAFTWGAREGLERAHHFQTSVSDCRGFSFEEFVTWAQINSIKHLTLFLSGVLHTYGMVKWRKARFDISAISVVCWKRTNALICSSTHHWKGMPWKRRHWIRNSEPMMNLTVRTTQPSRVSSH